MFDGLQKSQRVNAVEAGNTRSTKLDWHCSLNDSWPNHDILST